MTRRHWIFTAALLASNLPGFHSADAQVAPAADAPKRPVIGIASVTDKNYLRAVREAGGVPKVLPTGDAALENIDGYLKTLDGLLLPGGADIPPAEYGEEPHPSVKLLEPDRLAFERALGKAWIERTKKPLLGVCLGGQWINVLHGGSLVQDIPSEFQVSHRDTTHAVTLDADSRLSRIFDTTRIEVNSTHHQAVRKIGKGLRVVARSPDGLIEATESTDPNRFLIGVQWHPERLADKDPLQRKLFRAFVEAAAADETQPATPAPGHDSDFTLVVLPDTQDYADRSVNHARKKWGKDCSGYFGIQTAWVKDNARKLNIRFLLHTGDITQMDQPGEWRIAQEALAPLNGVVPYALAVGNHDMGCLLDESAHGKTATSRHSRLDEFFPAASISEQPWFADCLDDSLANAAYRFEQGALKFLILSLEFKPRDESLAWASRMVDKFPDHRVIVMTHGYMNPKGRKNSYVALPYQVAGNDGEQVWKKFVSRHRNIFLVLCGHTQGEGRRSDRGVHGNVVHQLLADYRHLENGGGSWLRYLLFRPTQNRIDVVTYNPALDRFMDGPESRFAIDYPMN